MLSLDILPAAIPDSAGKPVGSAADTAPWAVPRYCPWLGPTFAAGYFVYLVLS